MYILEYIESHRPVLEYRATRLEEGHALAPEGMEQLYAHLILPTLISLLSHGFKWSFDGFYQQGSDPKPNSL